MPFGSLIFVVIIAVWAAYLIQHWIRRRDHVATARSVDRFSEAMRVLERRRGAPAARAPEATPAAATTPARPAHPDVFVKRAEEPRRANRRGPQRRGSRRPWAAVRAAALLLGLLTLAVGAVVTTLSLGPWWVAPSGAAAFLLALGVVRLSVARSRRAETGARLARGRRSRRAAAPARRHARRPLEARVTTAPVAAARVRGSAPLYVPAPRRVEAVAAERPATAEAAQSPVVEVAVAPDRPSAAPYDVQAVEAAVAPEHAPKTVAEAATSQEPGTWQPVPVPTPTYMLKAKGHRSSSSATPRPAPASRPVSELPFDGHAMALEEEFEELPAVNLG